jgi:hypothetical protein
MTRLLRRWRSCEIRSLLAGEFTFGFCCAPVTTGKCVSPARSVQSMTKSPEWFHRDRDWSYVDCLFGKPRSRANSQCRKTARKPAHEFRQPGKHLKATRLLAGWAPVRVGELGDGLSGLRARTGLSKSGGTARRSHQKDALVRAGWITMEACRVPRRARVAGESRTLFLRTHNSLGNAARHWLASGQWHPGQIADVAW